MKVILAALNAKYIHTCLSVRCLYKAIEDVCDARYMEYTINDSPEDICRDLFYEKADCIAFSCYIWNIDMVLRVASRIKKACPNVSIVLGGHEVMYDAENVLFANPFVDAVLRGEGEITIREYISVLQAGGDLSSVEGITYRCAEAIVTTKDRQELCNLNSFPFVYDDSIEDIKNKIIYYESSRGCPYNCTYCISGAGSSVRFLDVERVKRELSFFISRGVSIVKFVDRTFNADVNRAKEILRFIADNPSDTLFHMELAGNLIDDETIDIVSNLPRGSVQFEIGVQTTNFHTMDAIRRKISFQKLSRNVKALISTGKVHIHLDLIAGLPFEDIASFKSSFEDVISLRPHVLQLGFLKLLKGSQIRNEEKLYGYTYSDTAPYEVISNSFVSYEDILEMKYAEEALERYYNSGDFAYTMDYLFTIHPCKFDLFSAIGRHLKDGFAVGYSHSKQQLFNLLYQCTGDKSDEFAEALKKDYLSLFRPGNRPSWMGKADPGLVPRVYEMFRNEDFKKEHFPKYYDVPAKEIMKHIHPEGFSEGVLIFDYSDGSITNISRFLS